MSRNTLTSEEWELIFALPADGQDYNVPGVAFRAKHLPATRVRGEQVLCETQYGPLRRRKVNGKWSQTDYVNYD